MIVVSIIALLSMIAIPAFIRAREKTRATAVANDVDKVTASLEVYAIENREWPDDVHPGELPLEIADYVPKNLEWGKPTALGDVWDWEGPGAGFSFTAGVSLRYGEGAEKQYVAVDEAVDDGKLTTGRFRRGIAGGDSFTYVLQW
jgi:type II secretory pathway pseudopilin PulG